MIGGPIAVRVFNLVVVVFQCEVGTNQHFNSIG